jgi:hypothetical protein
MTTNPPEATRNQISETLCDFVDLNRAESLRRHMRSSLQIVT